MNKEYPAYGADDGYRIYLRQLSHISEAFIATSCVNRDADWGMDIEKLNADCRVVRKASNVIAFPLHLVNRRKKRCSK